MLVSTESHSRYFVNLEQEKVTLQSLLSSSDLTALGANICDVYLTANSPLLVHVYFDAQRKRKTLILPAHVIPNVLLPFSVLVDLLI